jgi:hypothetical protein
MTDHYTIDDPENFADGELEDLEDVTIENADVWIAQDGGYLVKMDVVVTGTDAEGMEGAITIQYDLQDINEIDEIVLPEACANATDLSLPDMSDTMTDTEEMPDTEE